MFAYCRNKPVNRVDISGRADMECTDLDGNPTVDEEDIVGGSSSTGYGVQVGTNSGGGAPSTSGSGAMGGKGNSSTPESSGNNNVGSGQADNKVIPQHAWETLGYIRNHNGSPPKNYKGGREYANDGRNGGQVLPKQYGPYYEYDVHPKVAGQGRGTERIVVGNGAAWYTPDHYMTFWRME